MPSAPPHPPPRPQGPDAKHISLQYVGFHSAPSRREYHFRARSGSEAREYTIWIEHAAFAARQVLLQDGPHVCSQKLQRELAEFGFDGATEVAVTESDLASYRESHTTPARRRPSPRPAESTPGQPDGPPPFRRDEPA
jgi:hypothetical protein